MKTKKKRARTERREAERDAVKSARARLRLAELEPGGSRARPIDVDSPSAIEPHAAGMPCAACGAHRVYVDEHAVADGLRVARVSCRACGVRREVWFRLALPS